MYTITMSDSNERMIRFAAITPLNRREVMSALLERPSDRPLTSRRGLLTDFEIHIGTVDNMNSLARRACMEVGLEGNYRLAILVRTSGNSVCVRIWEDINQEELALINYFNFTPTVAYSREVDSYLRPFHPTQIAVAHINEFGMQRTFPRVFTVSTSGIAVPLMGLNRMIQAAKDTRTEFFNQR